MEQYTIEYITPGSDDTQDPEDIQEQEDVQEAEDIQEPEGEKESSDPARPVLKKGQILVKGMKYAVVLVIIVYVCLLLHYVGGSNQKFSKVAAKMEKVVDTEKLKDAGEQGLKRYYGLNAADYEGIFCYVATTSMSAQELLVVKVREESQVQEVEAAVERRLANRKNDFSGYAPKQVELLENAEISIRGKYIFMAVSPKASLYRDTFAKSL